jgi:ubiquinone/menaquinone biosynthesis C-methylase UbiE
MSFSRFFSEQARKPTGLFGKLIMSTIFNIGNAKINRFVYEIMSVKKDDHILEIGFGTGKLIYEMAKRIDKGLVQGVDFSSTMVSIAQRRNKKHISKGKVRIIEGDFDEMSFKGESFNKVCSINTIYFWPEPETTAKNIANILKPGGMFVVAFEDIAQLEQRQLSNEVFRLYSKDDVKNLLINAGFSKGVSIKSREIGSTVLHCAVAIKKES